MCIRDRVKKGTDVHLGEEPLDVSSVRKLISLQIHVLCIREVPEQANGKIGKTFVNNGKSVRENPGRKMWQQINNWPSLSCSLYYMNEDLPVKWIFYVIEDQYICTICHIPKILPWTVITSCSGLDWSQPCLSKNINLAELYCDARGKIYEGRLKCNAQSLITRRCK